MATAYRQGQQVPFDLAARRFTAFAHAQAGNTEALRHLDLEVLFNRLRLFGRSTLLYLLAFVAALIYFATERRTLLRVGLVLLLLALVPHTAGMIARMVIMGRPPVTNLYATFLFVGWVCVLLGLLLERMQGNGLGLLVASFGGLSMLMVANRFFSDGDTMGQVVAVLDSNFWLSTHVLAITVGYAGCLFAGVIGHLYLLQAIFGPGRTERLEAMYRALFGMLAFGLLFSFLGTMLGGVWADQSWGRFWGWDPKENGALLIVLWSAMLFHARPAGLIGRLGMAAGAVLGVNVVLAAWLGVNLLSVGLHSYGFTSGLAASFFAAIAFECAFVAVTVPLARRAQRAG
jgi:ABC-type transport system involved in cytochrome c biogenesis permease subunit